ncbi:MAG TPA: FG-GAP-like repeat-containing protein [Myxococcaceae bacterium]|nr:FG-GAP-like repeat-containing protein [Myxococcaceae bacterium]
MKNLVLRAVALAVLALAGCSTKTEGQPRPIASAGSDQTRWKGDRVVLDGSKSQSVAGHGLTYRWTQTTGATVMLADGDSSNPSFTAPRVTGTLAFSLVVVESGVESTPSVVHVQVQNRAPFADAGADLAAARGSTVTLSGWGSIDPDGDPLVATWTQVSGPAVALVDLGDGTARFKAPDVPAELQFQLTITDGEASPATDRVKVTVYGPGQDVPPTAFAGPDQEVSRNAMVTLHGAANDPDSVALTFAWTQVSGPSVSLTGADGPNPSFKAPAEAADLRFTLSVSDGIATGSDDVWVHVRNQAPVVGAIAIAPPLPRTQDDLTLQVSASDPDGDPLTVTQRWRRNGSLVSGQTGTTFPNALTTRGDRIEVEVTASDGQLQTFVDAGVTIQDSPAVLTASAPTSVDSGTLVSFQVDTSDPDGDPVGSPVLLHGPYGMALSDAGTVTWKAELPLFEQALDVHWAVGIAGTDPGLTGTIRVHDANRPSALLRSGFEIPGGRAGLRVLDLDGDGVAEALIAGRTGLYAFGKTDAGFAQEWMQPFPPGAGGVSAVAAADLDGDRRPEIAFSTGQILVLLDGRTRRELARLDLGSGSRCADLAMADLDRDGTIELVCLDATSDPFNAASARLRVLDALTLTPRWETPQLGLGTSLAVGNVDADPALELVTAGGYVFDGATHANEWAYGEGFGSVVAVGDLDGDGVAEIVGLQGVIRGYSAVLHSPVWEQAGGFGYQALELADLDGDGKQEVLAGDGQWGNVTAYRYVPASNSLTSLWSINSQDYGVSALGVGDLDGDHLPDVVWGTGAGSSGADKLVVAGDDAGISIKWIGSDPYQLDGPFLGAKLARLPGRKALVYEVPSTNSGYDGARLVTLDPATGAWSATPELGTNWNRTGALEVADVDGDGLDEAYLGTADYYTGYVGSWSFALGAPGWRSGTDTGTVVGLARADLSGDGHPDIVVVTSEGYVQAYDVRNQSLIWKSTRMSGAGRAVAVADLDGDGVAEIVALADSRLYVYRKATSGPASYLEHASVAVASGADLVVGDLDGAGAPAIVVLRSDIFASASISRYSGTLAVLGELQLGVPAQSLALEDLGPGRRNLVVGVGERYAFPDSAPAFLLAIDPASGAEIWRSPFLWSAAARGSIGYPDLRGDGRRALAFGTGLGMYVVR